MSSYWVNFASMGDPNGKGLPNWPAYDTATDQSMVFGDDIGVKSVPHREELDFFDAYFSQLRN